MKDGYARKQYALNDLKEGWTVCPKCGNDGIYFENPRTGNCLLGEKEVEKLTAVLQQMKNDRLKIIIMSRHNAKLAGINIDQVDFKGLKEMLGETWTQGDQIRAMTDEQLAMEFINHDCKRHCKNYNPDQYTGSTCLTIKSCSKGIQKYLESEVEV